MITSILPNFKSLVTPSIFEHFLRRKQKSKRKYCKTILNHLLVRVFVFDIWESEFLDQSYLDIPVSESKCLKGTQIHLNKSHIVKRTAQG